MKITILFTLLIGLISIYVFLPKLIYSINQYSNVYKRVVAARVYIKVILIFGMLISIRMLLTPPEPKNQSRRVVSENVIQLNQNDQIDLLFIYFDTEIAWKINRITLPLLILANILLFFQSRFNQSSTKLVSLFSTIVKQFKRFNYPAKKIYSFIWLSFILIYLVIVAVSWVTQYEFNVIEFASYLLGVIVVGLCLIFTIKIIELSAKLITWFNLKFPIQFLGVFAFAIGIPSVIAFTYFVLTILIAEAYKIIELSGLFI